MSITDDCTKVFQSFIIIHPEGLNLKFMCGLTISNVFYNMEKYLINTTIFSFSFRNCQMCEQKNVA
jgi:hypothetical protein